MNTSHRSISNEAAGVLAECAFFTGVAIGKALGAKTPVMMPDARQFWVLKHVRSIPIGLERAAQQGQTWDDHRETVLGEATRLGTLAAKYALEDEPRADVVPITLVHVERASKEVSQGPRCQAATKAGGGGYCEGFEG